MQTNAISCGRGGAGNFTTVEKIKTAQKLLYEDNGYFRKTDAPRRRRHSHESSSTASTASDSTGASLSRKTSLKETFSNLFHRSGSIDEEST